MTKKKDEPEATVDEAVEQAVAEAPPGDPLHAAEAAEAAIGQPVPPEPLVSVTPQEAPTPPQYATGAIKKQPEGLAVAIRTNILDPDGLKDWGIMTVDRGGHYGSYEEVENWADV